MCFLTFSLCKHIRLSILFLNFTDFLFGTVFSKCSSLCPFVWDFPLQFLKKKNFQNFLPLSLLFLFLWGPYYTFYLLIFLFFPKAFGEALQHNTTLYYSTHLLCYSFFLLKFELLCLVNIEILNSFFLPLFLSFFCCCWGSDKQLGYILSSIENITQLNHSVLATRSRWACFLASFATLKFIWFLCF